MEELFVEKFGGASVNTASAVRNVVSILKSESKKRVVVVSAMGKTTNSLERIINLWHKERLVNEKEYDDLLAYHFGIVEGLFEDEALMKDCKELVQSIVDESLAKMLTINPNDYDFLYDSLVSYGERISTSIISAYMTSIHYPHKHVFAQDLIKTDNCFRNSKVLWNRTEESIKQNLNPLLSEFDTVLTQGFIGATKEGYTTTLGREGSDFSAAILAYCLNAKSMTIWKDVAGLMNADPKRMSDTYLLEQVSYKEAMELSYYGASIIHPKTIKPLENKSIPLFVKSFNDTKLKGSAITDCDILTPIVPNYIFKDNQTLLSIYPKDFSFIAEDNISTIFGVLSKFGIKVNMMQNSALSFSVCFDQNDNALSEIIELLQQSYAVKYNNSLKLVTIRHYQENSIENAIDKERYNILIEQKSRITLQCLVEDKTYPCEQIS
ncbi:MAG: aspartate kinase [Bacteroidales bacterium]|nr:aspartate kinase [Bacteroidales bacterium]